MLCCDLLELEVQKYRVEKKGERMMVNDGGKDLMMLRLTNFNAAAGSRARASRNSG